MIHAHRDGTQQHDQGEGSLRARPFRWTSATKHDQNVNSDRRSRVGFRAMKLRGSAINIHGRRGVSLSATPDCFARIGLITPTRREHSCTRRSGGEKSPMKCAARKCKEAWPTPPRKRRRVAAPVRPTRSSCSNRSASPRPRSTHRHPNHNIHPAGPLIVSFELSGTSPPPRYQRSPVENPQQIAGNPLANENPQQPATPDARIPKTEMKSLRGVFDKETPRSSVESFRVVMSAIDFFTGRKRIRVIARILELFDDPMGDATVVRQS